MHHYGLLSANLTPVCPDAKVQSGHLTIAVDPGEEKGVFHCRPPRHAQGQLFLRILIMSPTWFSYIMFRIIIDSTLQLLVETYHENFVLPLKGHYYYLY